ncbi:uncharacterized protein LOC112564226 isoform X2 [Pomacea canaliculata]|uniref:uncharacterized protein LOC112564226 isoform X2 n=1 Tax=Pomacea canaliculata TaxID=400727 RepID=UPI000D726D4A|nr:uncharacterized protein LOC112564226 isoform X2 [Pomacea canaliculata]
MASAHHLLAAAFSLCGLLFLLHVVTVNSLRCKTCYLTNEPCNSIYLRHEDCGIDALCRTILFFYRDGRKDLYRDCVRGTDWTSECREEIHSRTCYYYCDTDNCNNATYEL